VDGPTPASEVELVARARRGDARAFAALVQEHQAIAFRTAYLITGDAAEAEDAAQDGLLRAYHALGRFRRGAPFRPWLLAIVANAARNRRRSSSRRAALVLRAGHTAPAPDEPSPEAALLVADERRTLLEAVGRLGEDHRLVVACRYFLDLGEAETAAVLGCPPGTVKSRLARALDRLRTDLGEDVR
jgi:RNA polymerase sigma-70 factor (ECF subfamily)